MATRALTSKHWMRIDNIVFPQIHQWDYGHLHKPSSIHNGKPIPDNVIYLDQVREVSEVCSREEYGVDHV